MSRGAWIAVLLLVATNAVWAVAWLGGSSSDGSTAYDADGLRSENARLQAQVEQLRASAPSPHEGALDGATLHGLGTEPLELPGESPSPDPSGSSNAPEGAAAAGTDDTAAAAAAEAKAKQAEALAHVKDILRKVMQVQDPALREEGLQELHAALASTEPVMVEYALSAMHSMRTLQIDRSGFRQEVLDLMDSPNAGIRRSALYALHATGVQEGDAQRALKAAQDPDPLVRMHALRVLKLYGATAAGGRVAEAAVKLLSDENSRVRQGALRGIADTKVAPEVEQALIAMSRRKEDHREAIREGLATLKDKSHAVIDVLFDALSDEDRRIRARAHWGLQRGIPEAQQSYVARRYAGHLEKFLNPKSHQEALKIIARHGDVSLVPELERFAENEMVDPRVRQMTEKVIDYLRAK